jgi:hypothetical protein
VPAVAGWKRADQLRQREAAQVKVERLLIEARAQEKLNIATAN